MPRQSLPVRLEQLGEHVAPVDQHAAHPRQVVEADVVDQHPLGRDPEQPRDLALDADRDVAEADRAMARVEQRPGDDPHGVREVDDPCVRPRELPDAIGDPEDDRHGAHRLRKASGARRLLADAPAGERGGLVLEPRRLAADPELEQDEAAPVDRGVEVVRDGERAAEALPLEHPRCHLTDDPAPLGVDVVEDELVDGDPGSLARQPGDELGRVGRPTTDDGELHPFTPVSVTPSTNAFCARKKTTTTGSMISSVAAIVRFHCTWCRLRNWASPIEATQWSGFSPT